jgi:hypothetical protein
MLIGRLTNESFKRSNVMGALATGQVMSDGLARKEECKCLACEVRASIRE